MKMKMTAAMVVAGLLAPLVVPTPVHAADKKKVVGAVLAGAGGALMFGAFDYHTSCPAGYSTPAAENLPTQCVSISRYGSDVSSPYGPDVRTQSTIATYQRPALMFSGVSMAAAGIVLMLLPTRVAKVADVTVTPTGWLASSTFRF
jgi:hypothetical protein